MSYDFLTEHQVHILLRIVTVGGMFLIFLLVVTFFSKRHSREKREAEKNDRRPPAEILPKSGWRKAKKKSRRR